MMSISASMVKELREQTGAGMMDCKKVLVEADGNMAKAAELLREKGLAGAAKKAGRIASEGVVVSYIHGGRIGSIIEINSETDFVAKNDDFQNFAKDMAMQVAASNPKYVRREEVPSDIVEEEREVLVRQAMNENAEKGMDEAKSKMIAEKKVEGRLNKFYEQICLLEQPFIKDPSVTVQELLTNLVAKIGENIQIRRFVRYEVGEGLEKREENFADEVAKQMGN
ncbi:translation elongation factor Ts [Gallicola sp. Sow4_E12]|uniref:translation elongation factor Ts n=1 Tax=Gallicola sp. Sow4_E12 TaxID=3438785 RepID=UPI003F8F282A